MACLCRFGEGSTLPAFAEPDVEPNYPPSRTARIEHLELWLDLFPREQRFTWAARLELAELPLYDGSVRFDLDEVDVESVTDGKGQTLDYRLLDGELEVLAASCPDVIEVKGQGANPRHGLYFTGPTEADPERPYTAWTQCQDADAHFIFPCHDHPRARHAWTIHLTGPKGYTLLSNGERGETSEEGERVKASFRQAEPMPAYLMTAVCAPLELIEDAHGDLALRYLFPKGRADEAQRAMGRTADMVALFEERTGQTFPWARYDQVVVHDFVFGGMENVGCTTMTELLLVDEAAALEWDPETLVAHELAHQWFGDLVTCIDWSHGWLNESWATFMESVWIDATRPEDEATWYRYELARSYFSEADGRYMRPIVEHRFREPIDVFDRHLYQKGASVLSTLRFQLGADAFWSGVQSYLERCKHGSVHTRDFQAALEDATGASLGQFFEQWIYTKGHPVLSVKLGREKGLVTVDIEQKQDADATREAFHVDLRLELVGTDGSVRQVTLPIRSRTRSFALPIDGELATVRVDPGFRFLGRLQLAGPRDWLTALLDDSCPVLAVRAANGLLRKGHPAAITAVLSAMTQHPSRFVREELVGLVAKQRTETVQNALLTALDAESDPRVRRAICGALAGFPDEAVRDALARAIGGTDATPHLIGRALKSLGELRGQGAVAYLTPFLDKRSWGEVIASGAARGLAATRRAEALEPLVASTHRDRPDRLRCAAIAALGSLAEHLPDARVTIRERLVEVLEEGGFRTSLAALPALQELGDPASLPAIERVRTGAADGRVMRTAYEAAVGLRRRRDARLSEIQDRADALARAQDALRERVDRLER